jgi:hypothetical protein
MVCVREPLRRTQAALIAIAVHAAKLLHPPPPLPPAPARRSLSPLAHAFTMFRLRKLGVLLAPAPHVKGVQTKLNITAGGCFGPNTKSAVVSYRGPHSGRHRWQDMAEPGKNTRTWLRCVQRARRFAGRPAPPLRVAPSPCALLASPPSARTSLASVGGAACVGPECKLRQG